MDQVQALRRYFDAHADDYDEYTGDGAWTPNQYLAGVLDLLRADDVEVHTALDLGTGDRADAGGRPGRLSAGKAVGQ